jgi:UDP-glucose 4-epimerase
MIEGLVMTNQLSACILRYFNPIGNHCSWTIWENPTQIPQNIMPIIMEVIEWKREYLSIFWNNYDTRDGTCVRDYIHVMDLAEAHAKALEWIIKKNKWKNIYEIINLWTGSWTTVLEIVNAVEEALNITLPYKIVEPRNWDLALVYGNCKKAYKLLWRKAKRTIKEAIMDMWKFKKDNFKF